MISTSPRTLPNRLDNQSVASAPVGGSSSASHHHHQHHHHPQQSSALATNTSTGTTATTSTTTITKGPFSAAYVPPVISDSPHYGSSPGSYYGSPSSSAAQQQHQQSQQQQLHSANDLSSSNASSNHHVQDKFAPSSSPYGSRTNMDTPLKSSVSATNSGSTHSLPRIKMSSRPTLNNGPRSAGEDGGSSTMPTGPNGEPLSASMEKLARKVSLVRRRGGSRPFAWLTSSITWIAHHSCGWRGWSVAHH